MSRSMWVAALLIAAMLPSQAGGLPCNVRSSYFRIRPEAPGFVVAAELPTTIAEATVRSHSTEAIAPNGLFPIGTSIDGLADQAASLSGAHVVYLDISSSQRVPLDGRWSGVTPFEAASKFLDAAGLELFAASERLWIVGPPGSSRQSKVSLSIYELDDRTRRWATALGEEPLGRALFAGLWVTGSRNPPELVGTIGLALLSEESEPELLAFLTKYSPVLRRDEYRAVKVRVKRSGSEISLTCEWDTPVDGWPLLGIREDLDGDGVADFIFQTIGDGLDMAVSARDGHPLAYFASHELAVSKLESGGRLLSVESMGEVFRPAILEYSPTSNKLVSAGTVSRAEAAKPASGEARSASRHLRQALGPGADITVYVLPGARKVAQSDIHTSVVRVGAPRHAQVGTTEMIGSGFPGRVIWEYRGEKRPADKRE